MNAEAAQCDQPIIRKKCGKDYVFTTNGYVSMDDEGSDHGHNSDDLFSDCEEREDITYYSPNVSRANNSTISNLSASSLLHSNHQYGTPAAVVPSTPLSLLPFLTKVSEQWASDLETPQADKTAGQYINHSTALVNSSENDISQKQCTPPISNMNKETQCITASPVIACRKIRNRTKRRIFRSAVVVSPSGSTLPNVNECAKPTEPQAKEPLKQTESENKLEKYVAHLQRTVVCKDNNDVNACINSCLSENSILNIINTSHNVNSHNTSTQDFFTNASFTDMDKLCENNLTEGNTNIAQVCEKRSSKNCEGGHQETVQCANHIKTCEQNEIKNILDKVNLCKRSVKDNITEERDKDVKINTKNEEQKIQNDCILIKTDIFFNTSIDTQDWFINESALNKTTHLCVTKSESADGASMNEQQQEGFVQNNILCDNIDDTDCTKKQQNVMYLSKRLTCAESEFDDFVKKVDMSEYEKSFCGFTTEEKSAAETKSLFTHKLICNLEGSDLFQQTVRNETCTIQNDNYCILSTAGGKSVSLPEKVFMKAEIFNPNEFSDNSKDAQLFMPPQAKKDNHPMDNDSCGFSTESGKSIALSQKALLTAKTLFANDFSENLDRLKEFHQFESTKEIVQFPQGACFSTASGKSIKLSDVALSKANAFFADEFSNKLEDELCLKPYKLEENEEKTSDPGCFRTANGQPIVSSDKALPKAKALLPDDTLDYNKDLEIFVQPIEEQKISARNLSNFTTAKGHPMKISQKTLSKATNLFADKLQGTTAQTQFANELRSGNEKSEFFIQKLIDKSNAMKNDDTCGFSTASGKSIAVCDKALSKANALFANDSEDNNENFEIFAQSFKKHKMNRRVSPKFSTAKGHPLKISQKALSKATNLFADELEETTVQTLFSIELADSNERSEFCVQKPMSKPNVTKNDDSSGVSTASGKSIAISDKALSKAQSLSADDFLNDNETSETMVQPLRKLMSNQKDLVAFKTANSEVKEASKTVKSLARNLFADEHNALPKANQPDIIDDNGKENVESIMFSTASGKPVNVSEKAIQKAQQLLLSDVDDTSEKLSSAKIVLGEKLPNVSNSMLSDNIDFRSALLGSTPNNDEFQSLQKRKISNSDDDTPVARRGTNHFKKPRFSDERQGRKLFSDDINTEKKINTRSPQSVNAESGCEPLQVLDEQNNRGHKVARSLSDEIAASASALLADETNNSNLKNCTSPAREKETEQSLIASSCSTSPVLGRPTIPQRRSKRKTIGCTNINVPDSEQNIVSCNKKVRLSDSVFCAKSPQSDATTNTLQSRTNLDNVKTNNFVDTQLIMDYIDKTTVISEKRLAAGLEQDKIIRAKKRNKPKQTVSTLLLYKESNRNDRISWKKLTNGAAPTLCSYKEAIERNISQEILNMTTNSAAVYRFRCSDFYGDNVIEANVNGLEMVDGSRLILDENGYVGLPEIIRAFMASPGIDPALLPVGWIKNHYCWIVWKLASMDRVKFSSVSLPRALTPARVMEQLKYRYDREIDKSQRPALRRILEKDDAASKRMVLCVSSLVECKNAEVVGKSPSIAIASSWKMVLTDGWYSVPACIDLAMINNIISGKVRNGTKLVTCGAELLNSDQGCSPLEIPGDISLKIHTNSTRRAKWYAKMGFSSCPGPIPVKLQNVCPHGGLIGKLTVTIVRVYPLIYHEKTITGESIFRNARCEEKANLAYEQECRSKMEALYEKTEKYFSVGKKNLSTDPNTDSMDFLAAELSEQCQNLSEEEFMSKQQQESLLNECRMKEEKLKQKLESKLRENLPPQRKVSPVLKLRVADEKKCAILTIWSPSDDVIDILKEGNRVLMCGVSASGKRGDELQLTAGRSTVFKLESKNTIGYPSRICTPLCRIADPAFNPTYGELDTVGLIVSIQNGPYGMKNFEAVNLVCPRKHSSDFSYLSILFWQSIAAYGYKEILAVGSFVACSNLEWRRATAASIPLAYCTERTIFTRNPRQIYLQSAIDTLKASITEPDVCIANCTEEISAELQKKLTAKSPGYITPNKPIPNTASQKSTGQNLGSTNSSIVNPRSSSVQKRLEKLKWYGEPSELPPIIVNTRSTRISLDFRSPVANRKVTPTRPT